MAKLPIKLRKQIRCSRNSAVLITNHLAQGGGNLNSSKSHRFRTSDIYLNTIRVPEILIRSSKSLMFHISLWLNYSYYVMFHLVSLNTSWHRCQTAKQEGHEFMNGKHDSVEKGRLSLSSLGLAPSSKDDRGKEKKKTTPKQPTKKTHHDTSEFWKSPTLLVTPHLLPSHGVKFGSWNRGIWPRTVFIAGSINESLSKGLNHRFSLVHWYSSQELPVNEDILEEPACLWLGDIPPSPSIVLFPPKIWFTTDYTE